MTSAWRPTRPAISSTTPRPKHSSSCSARDSAPRRASSLGRAAARRSAAWSRPASTRSRPVSTPLWGGRFSKPLDERALTYTTSLPIDKRLFEWDVLGSIAHARMLSRQGIIAASDAAVLVSGLSELLARPPALDGAYEDVHSLVEAELAARVGEAAGRLQTAGSRNGQGGTGTALFRG